MYVSFSGLSHVLHSMSELMQVQEPDDSNEEFITLSEGSFSLQSYNRKQVCYIMKLPFISYVYGELLF